MGVGGWGKKVGIEWSRFSEGEITTPQTKCLYYEQLDKEAVITNTEAGLAHLQLEQSVGPSAVNIHRGDSVLWWVYTLAKQRKALTLPDGGWGTFVIPLCF